MDNSKKILIVGLGLLGGSYAIALKKKGYQVAAIARRDATIEYALSHGIIDKGYITPDESAISEADVIISGLYPTTFIDWIKTNQQYFKAGAILTDVTGVKTSVVYSIQEILRSDVEFIAAHPMAGRETSGVEHADDKIFKGANYIVVPSDKNTEKAIQECKELGEILGFEKISVLSPEEHDEMIAFLSQLTHCIAVSLMNTNDNDKLVDYTGDSFRDLTRIAKINDAMWSELFIMNKAALLKEMDLFINEFTNFRNLLENEDVDGMRKKMQKSTERRIKFDKKRD